MRQDRFPDIMKRCFTGEDGEVKRILLLNDFETMVSEWSPDEIFRASGVMSTAVVKSYAAKSGIGPFLYKTASLEAVGTIVFETSRLLKDLSLDQQIGLGQVKESLLRISCHLAQQCPLAATKDKPSCLEPLIFSSGVLNCLHVSLRARIR